MPMNFLRRLFGGDSSRPEQHARESRSKTFRERAEAFWAWYADTDEARFAGLQCDGIDPEETRRRVHDLHEDLAWEYCSTGDDEDGRQGFALSGEGNTTLRLLTNYVVSKAPAFERWTIYTSKQASDGELTVKIGGDELDFADFCFALDFDKDEEWLQVSVNHPKFAQIPKDTRQQLTMIALDNALGENFVEAWIGRPIVDTPERTPEQKFEWAAIRPQARAAIELYDLNPDLDPIDRWCSYSYEDPGDGDVEARADIIAGSTCHLDLVLNFANPEREDQLAGSGASFAYLMFGVEKLTLGEQVDERGGVEDALLQAMRHNESGMVIGGAMGAQYAYIDLILFDEARALDAMRQILPRFEFVEAAALRYFAPKRRQEFVSLVD